MEWVLALVPTVILFAVGGGLVMWNQQRTKALKEGLAARGWRYETKKRGFAVEGGDVLPWTITVRRSQGTGSSNRNTETIWEAPVEPAEAVVLAGPKLPAMLAGLDLGGMLVQKMLQAVLGDDAADLADAEMLPHGEGAFAEQFSVVTSDPVLARALLDEHAQRLLVDGPDKITLLRWKDRLQLRLPWGVRDVDTFATLVALGEALTAER